MSGKNSEEPLLQSLQSEVHVWFCCPDEITDKTTLDMFHSILSDREREKYKRFHFEKDRHSYLISHALVRKVLSSYCSVQPKDWRFTNNKYGKPGISADIEAPAIKFNLSHTDGMSVIVVTLEANCGVDVENITRKCRSLAVAERMFAEPEVTVVRESNDTHSKFHFFEFWTLREAYVKALGTGLGGSNKDFYFTLEDTYRNEASGNETSAKINFLNASEATLNWQFLSFMPVSNYVAAVAVNSDNAQMVKKIVSRKFTL